MRAKTHFLTIRPVTLIGVLALLFTIVLSTPVDAAVRNSATSSSQSAWSTATMLASGRAVAGQALHASGKGLGNTHPAQMSVSELATREAMVRRMHPTTPHTPIGNFVTSSRVVHADMPFPGKVSPHAAINSSGVDLGNTKTADVNEPSVATDGHAILQTWNWYSAISANGGQNWTYYDPSKLFPNSYGGWCCDSVTTYDPSRNLFLWNLNYVPNTTGNAFRLAVAHGAGNLANATFTYWDLTPQQVGGNPGDMYDFPIIALSSNYAYLQGNIYNASGQYANRTVVMRFALNDLTATSGSLSYYYQNVGLFSVAFSNGATNVMYYASHVDTSTLRVFIWPENVTNVGSVDIKHVSYPAFPSNGYDCSRSGVPNSNWCSRSDDRVSSGWISKGILAFSWNAPQGKWGFSGSAPYPYTDIVRISLVTGQRIDDPIVYGSSFAFEYMAFSPNANGGIGSTYLVGGGSAYETAGVGIWDTVGRDFQVYASSTQDANEGGDYLSVHAVGNVWLGTGYAVLANGTHTYAVLFKR